MFFAASLRLATPRQWAYGDGLSPQLHWVPCKQPQGTGALLPSPHFLRRADEILFTPVQQKMGYEELFMRQFVSAIIKDCIYLLDYI